MCWTFSAKKTRLSLYEFRLDIIRKLLPHNAKPERLPVIPRKNIDHLPTKQNGKTLRKKCRMCKIMGNRKDTIYQCVDCPELPGLCLDPCFKSYHNR